MGELIFPALSCLFSCQCIHIFFPFSPTEFRPLTNLFKPTTEFIFYLYYFTLFSKCYYLFTHFMQFSPHRQKCFGLAAAVWLAFAPISV